MSAPRKALQMSCEADYPVVVSNVQKIFKPSVTSRRRLAELLGVANGRDVSKVDGGFVALEDVSFRLEKGKTFGIMGQNGSGKSTLLQIISGILEPTKGSIETRGTIAALLELGSGFNPEFTGIENIYLNASVLGMSQSDVEERLGSIIEFAEIGDHIHAPVRTYSSGMMLRLAFAVQVAIEPEILIIDEALAVGDVRFQLKCFRRLEDLKKKGTTILFVSHATELVKSFCDEALVLDKGKQVFLGPARTATIKYLETIFPETHSSDSPDLDTAGPSDTVPTTQGNSLIVDSIDQKAPSTFGVGGAELLSLRIDGIDPPNIMRGGREKKVTAAFKWDPDVVEEIIKENNLEPNITLGILLADRKGVYLFGANGFDSGLKLDYRAQQHARLEFKFQMPYLADGDYFIGVAIAVGNQESHVQLRWYDCFLPVKCTPEEKKVFGLIGLDYEISNLE
ncbi:MAG: ABC transporter ATP-binding protein [Roseobacter sp.]